MYAFKIKSLCVCHESCAFSLTSVLVSEVNVSICILLKYALAKHSLKKHLFVCLFECCFNVPVNNYAHVETASFET